MCHEKRPLQALIRANWGLPKRVTTLWTEPSHWAASTEANPGDKQDKQGTGNIYIKHGFGKPPQENVIKTAQQESHLGN